MSLCVHYDLLCVERATHLLIVRQSSQSVVQYKSLEAANKKDSCVYHTGLVF